ncbi:Ku protein [Patescibacteria group bacterium]|nr:Ku protein [Patescibacteria group bacterium]
MRSIWSGSVSFGLVNIPIKLYSAVNAKNLDLDMLHKEDMGQIRYARICKKDGHEIPYEDIVKGYEYEEGDYVVLTQQDFEKANARKTNTVDIIDFASEDEINPIYFEKPYYLEPQKGSGKAYVLLREALKKSKKVGIAKFVIRNREHLGVVKPEGNILVLNQMRFQEEIRQPELKIPKEEVSHKEIEMALSFIDQLTEPFKPEEYKDTYIKELKRVIKEKSQGKTPKTHGEAPKPTEVDDLMAALKASLEQQKQARLIH